jgi:hypothetical protein
MADQIRDGSESAVHDVHADPAERRMVKRSGHGTQISKPNRW